MLRRFLALLFFVSSIPSTFAADEVRLAWAQSVQCPPISGCYSRERTFGVIEVKNLAFEKVVEVAYKSTWTETEWFKTKATYLAPAANGYEAWTFEAGGPVEAFAIAYTVAGKTYWDNNNGQNYRSKRYDVDLHLGESRPLAVISAYVSWDNKVWVNLAVDGKYVDGRRVEVKIGDGDKVQTLEAAYQKTYASGFQSWLASVPVSEDVNIEHLLVSAQLGDFADTNYGLFHRVKR